MAGWIFHFPCRLGVSGTVLALETGCGCKVEFDLKVSRQGAQGVGQTLLWASLEDPLVGVGPAERRRRRVWPVPYPPRPSPVAPFPPLIRATIVLFSPGSSPREPVLQGLLLTPPRLLHDPIHSLQGRSESAVPSSLSPPWSEPPPTPHVD